MKSSKAYLIPLASIIATIFFVSGCYYDNLEELRPAAKNDNQCDSTKTMSFASDIKPILADNCGSNSPCHQGSSAQSGIDLSAYAGVKSKVDDGKLISAITWVGSASKMPKNSPTQINNCAITKIKKWVAAGAPEN